jgi:hypothetical protein
LVIAYNSIMTNKYIFIVSILALNYKSGCFI